MKGRMWYDILDLAVAKKLFTPKFEGKGGEWEVTQTQDTRPVLRAPVDLQLVENPTEKQVNINPQFHPVLSFDLTAKGSHWLDKKKQKRKELLHKEVFIKLNFLGFRAKGYAGWMWKQTEDLYWKLTASVFWDCDK